MHGHWKPEWRDMVADRRRPLHERLEAYYLDYWPRIFRRVWYRGFIFFALSDPTFAQDYLQQVNREILELVIGEVRHDFGFPPVGQVPIHEREHELIWGMHSTFAFLGQRRFIYEMPMPEDLPAMIHDQVSAYLTAVPTVMADVMPRRKPLARSASRARYIRTRAKRKTRG